MSKDLHAELANMIGPVQWQWLEPQLKRDAVVIVNPHLDLAEVGVAVATDNAQAVEHWITEQLITKPNAQQLTRWRQDNKRFASLIVQPYVLVQDTLEQNASEPAAPTDAPS
ncbi:MAG: DUF2288 domain-containing protein [Phormidesmis sp.]